MTTQISPSNKETKSLRQYTTALCFFVSFVSYICTPLLTALPTKEETKNKHTKKTRKKKTQKRKKNLKRNTRKRNPNQLKALQKRDSISIGYAEIKTKRMLSKARVAKKDQEGLSASIMNKVRTQGQKNRINRDAFTHIVKQEIKTHKKSKKQIL